jgi:hypothetical protein
LLEDEGSKRDILPTPLAFGSLRARFARLLATNLGSSGVRGWISR